MPTARRATAAAVAAAAVATQKIFTGVHTTTTATTTTRRTEITMPKSLLYKKALVNSGNEEATLVAPAIDGAQQLHFSM